MTIIIIIIIGKKKNILKYTYFIIEIQRMWNVKTKATPATRGAIETTSK
jgi:hypothetical protein